MKKAVACLLISLSALFALVACAGNADPPVVVKDKNEKVLEQIRGSEKLETAVDYGDRSNWFAYDDAPQKDVDVIYFCPRLYTAPEGGNELSSAGDKTVRAEAPKYLDAQAAVFTDRCNLFAPFYRMYDLSFLASLDRADRELAYGYAASKDAIPAIDYYFKNVNGGRPFILAGHGQGSDMVRMILAVYMKEHPDVYRRMVAAYAIGCAVTRPYLNEHKHLKFAKGESDVGVIVSYNTEGQGNYGYKDDFIVERLQTLVINPLNWKTDKTYAFPRENLGMMDERGEIVKGLADARVNPERGTVVCDNDSALKSFAYDGRYDLLFGPQSYHYYDYAFFFENLRQNVSRRIDAYLSAQK